MPNPLPFQYQQRAASFERLDGQMRTIVLEERDRALEDYLGRIGTGAPFVVKGTYFGTSTPLPTSPAVNDLWVIGTPVPTLAPARTGGGAAQVGDGMVWTGTAWVNTGSTQGPAGPTGPAGIPGPVGPTGAPGATGPAGPDEVWIGAGTPAATSQELWIDTDEDPAPGGTDEVWIGAGTPSASTLELWVDVDEDPSGGGAEEVWIGPSAPAGAYDLWVDTSS